MLWKIYFWVFAFMAVLSTISSSPNVNILFAGLNVCLSTVALVVLFMFAYGKRVGSLKLWKIFAAVFIVFDLAYNLFIYPVESVPSLIFGLIFTIPLYVAVAMYGFGRLNISKLAKEREQLLPAPEGARGPNPFKIWITAVGLLWSQNKLLFLLLVVVPVLPAIAMSFVAPSVLSDLVWSNPAALFAGFCLIAVVSLFFNLATIVVVVNSELKPGMGWVLKVTLTRFPAYLGLIALSILLVVLGMVCFVFPAAIVAFRIMMAPYVMIDKGVGPVAALKASNRLMAGNAVETLGVYCLGYIAMFATLSLVLVPVAGGVISNLLMMFAAVTTVTSLGIVYRNLNQLREDNTRRPKTSRANIWLPVVVAAIYLVLVGVVTFYIQSEVQNTTDHETPCYTVTLPTAFSVSSPGKCRLLAESSFLNIEYRPVGSSARSAAGLAKEYADKLFPASVYKVFSKSAEAYTVDGVSKINYVFENKKHSVTEVVFVNLLVPIKVSGVETRNFVLISSQNADWRLSAKNPLSFLAAGAVGLSSSAIWNAGDGYEFNSDMRNFVSYSESNDYSGMAASADNALAAAQTDSQKSLALGAKGAALYDQDKMKDAEAAFRSAVEADPGNLMAWDYLGSILAHKQDYDGVLLCADKIVQIDPDYADAYNLYGVAYQWRGDRNQALKNYRKAVQLNPKNEAYRNNALYLKNTQK
jgi:tetratricopeptide (TPR) repeat protein